MERVTLYRLNRSLELPMRLRRLVAALSLLLSTVANAQGQTKTVAERLGFPADSKLLIVHADDLAVAHSVDTASFEALDKNAVTSASVMVPCSWLIEVASYAKDHPDTDLGLHLTLTSEWNVYRWGPVESKDKVGSLLDPAEYLWKQVLRRKISSPKKQSGKFAPRFNARSQPEFIRPTWTATWACFFRRPISLQSM
jgi:hypothetical protein